MTTAIRYRRNRELKLRPLPQWGNLLVFTPAQPRFHWLNLNAWIIFELCEGLDEAQLRLAYLEAVASKLSLEEAMRHLESGLALLRAIGAVETQTS